MNKGTTLSALLAGSLFLAGCPGDQEPTQTKNQYLEFTYAVGSADPEVITELGAQMPTFGDLDHDFEPPIPTDCQYVADFMPGDEQTRSDRSLAEQTRVPTLKSIGDSRAPGFRFVLTAINSRNKSEVCKDLANTIQGIELISSEAPANSGWHRGEEIQLMIRPSLTPVFLGSAEVFSNLNGEEPLLFHYAIDQVDAAGFTEGRFHALATSELENRFVLIHEGRFGLYNRPAGR